MTDIEIQIFQKMPPAEKLRVASDLYETAYELKKAAIRKFNPGLSEADVAKRVAQSFLYKRN